MQGPQSSYEWKSRLSRAFVQRIYLMEAARRNGEDNSFTYQIMGSVGKDYAIAITPDTMKCSCPDHAIHGNLCKHLLFVLIRASGVSNDDVFRDYFQTKSFKPTADTLERCNQYITRREQSLANVIGTFEPNPVDDPTESAAAPQQRVSMASRRQAYYRERFGARVVPKPASLAPVPPPKFVDRREYSEECCPICCEDFKDTANEETSWCKLSCGNSVHSGCFSKWSDAAKRNGRKVQCVHCRGDWYFG